MQNNGPLRMYAKQKIKMDTVQLTSLIVVANTSWKFKYSKEAGQ